MSSHCFQGPSGNFQVGLLLCIAVQARGLGNPSRALLGRNEAKHPALLWCKPKDPLWMALFFHSPPIFELHMKICAEQKSDDQNENIKANNRQVKDAESILPYRSK